MSVQGLPLLSGLPPSVTDSSSAETACRKCNKEFNIIFTRSRKCNHCGYSYCHSCSDFQALLPRIEQGNIIGYDSAHVCGYCIEYLSITAASRFTLRTLPLAKLKNYANAYNIKTTGAVEKDDVVDAIMRARTPTGALSLVNESFYRKYSVPTRSGPPRGLFSRAAGTNSAPPTPPRPTPTTSTHPSPGPQPANQPRQPPPPPPRPQQQQQQWRSNPTPPQPPPPPPRSARPHLQPDQPNPHGFYRQFSASRSSGHIHTPAPNAAPRQRTMSSTPPVTPPAPPPTLDELLNMSAAAIGTLTIHALKSILFTNHINAGQALEKSDLVRKVVDLVEEERRHRERHRRLEEEEEREQIERQRAILEQFKREREVRERVAAQAQAQTQTQAQAQVNVSATTDAGADADAASVNNESIAENAQAVSILTLEAPTSDVNMGDGAANADAATPGTSPIPATPLSTPSPPPPRHTPTERGGMCVICQDDEANIAVVDCGHLAMCKGCSDLIMSSTRECPLCRTRIVTEQRLLRIYRV